MKQLILLILPFLLISCDNASDSAENITYLPNKAITFHDQLVYYDKEPFTGTLMGYDIDNNSECPDEITVDLVNGLIQGRAQAVTLEDIDVLYQLNAGKLDGWSTVLFARILYRNDTAVECSTSKVVSNVNLTAYCSRILGQNPLSPDSTLTTGALI